MSVFDFLTFVFGISLFLFGMNLMGETLKKSAGRRLKVILGKLAGSKIRGFALGVGVTAVIQSSSAATVMVVGFVNSDTMLLSQAVGVIMGANVGTTVTSWITALAGLEGGSSVSSIMQWFKPSTFTPIVALVGLWFYLSTKSDRRKSIGLILLGFSVLMVGMETMSDSVSGLASNDTFRSILLAFENPLLGLFAGMVLTAIIQSSSASIGILQSFTATGAITFGNAVPIIMGQNIGTCITALISSAGASKNAKRAAVVHLLFNVFGSIIGLIIFYILKLAFNLAFLDGSIDMGGIAIVHTVFNIVSFLVLFPLSRQIERLAVVLVRDKKGNDEFSIFDERLLGVPSVAIERSREGALKMASTSIKAFEYSCLLLESYDEKIAHKVRKYESISDEYEDRLGTYLLRISEESILDTEKNEASKLLHMIGDFERISDHAVNLVESAEEMDDKKLRFSISAQKEISVLISAVREITTLTYDAINEKDIEKAKRVESLEQVIDGLRDKIKRHHIVRLQSGECSMEHGFILSDILNNLERIADHCSNIAGCYIEMFEHKSLELHKYLKKYRDENQAFEAHFKEYAEKYVIE
ncbi:MAG: Na/Pi cotransporter family protein [Ruminococcaceae bacterium]|nr:Na/Pi cotransporter family protein [Oscillospiraceae bacterium]